MPKLSKAKLIEKVIASIKACGWNVLVLNSGHPARLSVFNGEQTYRVILYIWNLTHGGYPRDPDELRIQITGVSRFAEEPDAKTLILGWSDEEEAFAGFDVTQHRIDMTGRSPSFQIRRETLHTAQNQGIATQVRGNNEIAIGLRPDLIVAYIQQLDSLHGSAGRAGDLQILDKIAATPPEQKIVEIPPGPRRVQLQQVQRKLRDARFRTNVMAAYQNRCAVSGIQLDVLDAAHIVPVEDDTDGTDELQNGICLTAMHHRAFDRGLLGIKKDYTVILNPKKLATLQAIGWDGGLDLFKQTLRHQINLPAKKEHYPDPAKLLKGQELRGWSAALL